MKRSTIVSGAFTLSLLVATLFLAAGSTTDRALASMSPSASPSTRCYCCLDGEVSNVRPEVCKAAGQSCCEREANAKARCRPPPPPPKK
jgi:hypothetical protein